MHVHKRGGIHFTPVNHFSWSYKRCLLMLIGGHWLLRTIGLCRIVPSRDETRPEFHKKLFSLLFILVLAYHYDTLDMCSAGYSDDGPNALRSKKIQHVQPTWTSSGTTEARIRRPTCEILFRMMTFE
jgi:hypothetical protein